MSVKITGKVLFEILEGKYSNQNSIYRDFYEMDESGEINSITIRNASLLKIEKPLINLEVNIPVAFYDCSITIELDFLDHRFKNGLSFVRCTLGRNILSRGTFSKLVFQDCKFSEFKITGGIYDSLSFFSSYRVKLLEIVNGYFGHIELRGSDFEKIVIVGQNFYIDSLVLPFKVRNTDINISFCNIGILRCPDYLDNESKLSVSNVILRSIFFSNTENNGIMSFSNISPRHFGYEISKMTIGEFFKSPGAVCLHDESGRVANEYLKFVEKSNLSESSLVFNLLGPLHKLKSVFSDEPPEQSPLFKGKFDPKDDSYSSLSFVDSIDFGQCVFRNCEIGGFKEISIRGSDITNIKFFNSEFPIDRFQGDPVLLYETFNQLMIIAKKSENKKNEILYQKVSKSYLLRVLKSNVRENVSSLVSLYVSKYYSNYGTSWIRSLIVTLSIGGLFFILMMLSSHFSIDFSDQGIDNFFHLLTYYVQFINPTHKITFMDESLFKVTFSANFGFVFFDLSGRVLIGIGIYEMIKSFRKLSVR
jgi:hypothetical protein